MPDPLERVDRQDRLIAASNRRTKKYPLILSGYFFVYRLKPDFTPPLLCARR